METAMQSTGDILVLVFFLLVMPGTTFLLLRRSRMLLRITLTVLVLVTGGLAIPLLARARVTVSVNSCAANLRLIQAAKQSWAAANQKTPADEPSLDELFKGLQTTPQCPIGGTYLPRAVGEKAECSSGAAGHTLEAE